jgi:ribosomal protein S6
MPKEPVLYEAMYILKPEMSDEQIEELEDRLKVGIEGQGAVVQSVHLYARRRMAYEINGYREGIFRVMYFVGHGPAVEELKHEFLLSEDVIRGMITIANPRFMVGEKPGKPAAAAAEEAAPVEEAPAEEVAEEVAPEEATAEVVAEEVAPEEAPAEEVAEEVAPEEAPTEEAAEEAAPEEAPAEEVAEEVAPEEAPAEEAAEEVAAEEAPAEEAAEEVAEEEPKAEPAA